MRKIARRHTAFPELRGKLTRRAARALELADDEARRLRHDYIGTEHVLLGLLDEGDGVAAVVLRAMAGDTAAVRGAVEAIVRIGDAEEPGGELTLTPRSKRALAYAEEEARTLGHHYLGTEHLLLGIIREGEGIAAGALQTLGIDLDGARTAVTRALAGLGFDERPATKDHVVTCRIDSRDLDAIDALVESGVRSTRSDAAAWLIHAGVEAHRDLLARVYGSVAEIRRLREEVARALTAEASTDSK